MQPFANRTRWSVLCAAVLLAGTIAAQAESNPAFFRVVGPARAGFTRAEPGGILSWTNPVLNATCHVQIATSLLGAGNWRDYQHSCATTVVSAFRMFDATPPSGMAFVPAGICEMGDATNDQVGVDFGDLSESPVHTVRLGAFYVGTCEVSQGEWESVRAWALGHGYVIDCAGNGKATNHPVGNVCWHDAVRWCNAKSEMEGLTPCYYTNGAQATVYRAGDLDLSSDVVKWGASGYRLPCESEWEYASRGGAQGARFAFGASISHAQANYYSTNGFDYDVSPTRGPHPDYDDGEPYTSPVGEFSGNGYGLHDVAGNVSEWCWDRSDGVCETCGDCGGYGLVACPDCGGTGSVDCSTCGGAGYLSCDSCGGSGYIETTCTDCGGSGGVDCSPCGGGGWVDVTCSDCGGNSYVNCPDCGGTGDEACSDCGGSGSHSCTQCGGSGTGNCESCAGSGSETCPDCGGSGCDSCGGYGYVACANCGGSGSETCTDCGGAGSCSCCRCAGSGDESCSNCEGRGELWSSGDYYSLSGTSNPRGPSSGDRRIVRGGDWDSDANGCRVSRRAEGPPSETKSFRGFRVVRSAAE